VLKIPSKIRYITVILLVLSVMFISFSTCICKADENSFSTFISQEKFTFSSDDFVETFFFYTKTNHPDESFFAQTKNRRQSVRQVKCIESEQSAFGMPLIDDEKKSFPLYDIICIFIVQVIIRYIYNTDGKKRRRYSC